MQSLRQKLFLTAVCLALSTNVFAFQDASPYFISSSSYSLAIPKSFKSRHILPVRSFLAVAKEAVSRCDSDAYLLISQPGLHIEDITGSKDSAVHLNNLLGLSPPGGSWTVENVFMDSDKLNMQGAITEIEGFAQQTCGALLEGVDPKTGSFSTFDSSKPKVIKLDLISSSLDFEDSIARAKTVEMNDALLGSVLQMFPAKARILTIFASSPRSVVHNPQRKEAQNIAKPPGQSGSNIKDEEGEKDSNVELKRRDLHSPSHSTRPSIQKPGEPDEKPTNTMNGLFHQYQFFTPSIFMGYVVFIVLAIIFYAALSGLTSLEISYRAFEKDAVGTGGNGKKQ